MRSLKILQALNDIDEKFLLENNEENEKISYSKKWYEKIKYSYILTPACAIILLAILVIEPHKNNDEITIRGQVNSLEINKEYSINISINEINTSAKIKEFGESALDMDGEVKEYVNIPYFEILSELKIPEDFDNKESWKAIWVKSDAKSNNYDILNNYELNCFNTKNNRSITIAFSDKYQPLRDYYFINEEDKISMINDVELKIYKQNNMYIAMFKYNNFNFDIETSDISEEELINLLTSIIK